MEVLLADTADGTSTTVPAAETDLKTFTPRENSFPLIRVEADVSISMVAASLAQAVTFRLRVVDLLKPMCMYQQLVQLLMNTST